MKSKPSPKSSTFVTPSPLVRRIPSMLGENEEFLLDHERNARESTPRSKRLRRESQIWSHGSADNRRTRESTTMSTTATAAGLTATKKTRVMETTNKTTMGADTVKEESGAETEAVSGEDDEDGDDAQTLTELSEEGFTPQEAALFLRIRNRSLEPLMPAHWQVDFSTMPDNLFFPADENVVGHIDSITLEGTFVATSAFQALVGLGTVVRGKIESKRDPEERVCASLKKYIQWSVEDVRTNLKDRPEINPRVVVVGSNGKGPVHCETRMQKKLGSLAKEVHQEFDHLSSLSISPPPNASTTVYGLAVSGCVVALVTLDTNLKGEDATPRTMIILDFSDITLDFWNAVAVALLVIAAREDELERSVFYEQINAERLHLSKRRGWEARSRLSIGTALDDDL